MVASETSSPLPARVPADPVSAAPFLAACHGQPVDDRVPVWFMRQAGRSLPEYKRVRSGISMLDSCARPELVAEITMQPVRRYGVDAAIFYSDIMVPLKAAGVGVDIVAGTGPVIADPIRSERDLDRVPALHPEALEPIEQAVRLLVAELGETPLIGFAGAPFTLASYLVEGGPSRDYARTKALMLGNPELWDALCARLADISATFLEVQVRAGARAVQLFDSWVGSLALADYRRFVQPHSSAVLERIGRLGVPRIHFGVGTGELLVAMRDAGADVMGVDFRLALSDAAARLGHRTPVQGNLDPAFLAAPWDVLADRVRDIIRSGAAAPGHVFNLGHGVPPGADPDVLARIVELVQTEGAELRRAAAH